VLHDATEGMGLVEVYRLAVPEAAERDIPRVLIEADRAIAEGAAGAPSRPLNTASEGRVGVVAAPLSTPNPPPPAVPCSADLLADNWGANWFLNISATMATSASSTRTGGGSTARGSRPHGSETSSSKATSTTAAAPRQSPTGFPTAVASTRASQRENCFGTMRSCPEESRGGSRQAGTPRTCSARPAGAPARTRTSPSSTGDRNFLQAFEYRPATTTAMLARCLPATSPSIVWRGFLTDGSRHFPCRRSVLAWALRADARETIGRDVRDVARILR
jgi:hypothetical protein